MTPTPATEAAAGGGGIVGDDVIGDRSVGCHDIVCFAGCVREGTWGDEGGGRSFRRLDDDQCDFLTRANDDSVRGGVLGTSLKATYEMYHYRESYKTRALSS